MTRALFLLFLVLLPACAAKTWRTADPVTQSTYEAPSSRSPTSIGRLARLAVVAVNVHVEASEKERLAWSARSDRLAQDLQVMVTDYLIKEKGYEARAVNVSAPSEEGVEMRELGASLGVDGLVVVERRIRIYSIGEFTMSFFLGSVPAMYSASKPHLIVSIYEAASGRLVWRHESVGEGPINYAGGKRDEEREVDVALRELENAVPPQLRR